MPLTVGSRATATCLSPSGLADKIEWFDSKGNSLISTTSMQELMLVLDPVNDSGLNFTCHITKPSRSTEYKKTLVIAVKCKNMKFHSSLIT